MINELKQNKKKYLFIFFMVAVYLFTRFYRILTQPEGMHVDELAMAYNTWSLADYGIDRYGMSYPIYFENVRSGQSCLMIYLTVVLCKVFGYNLFLVRLVPILLGLVTVYCTYKICKELFDERTACCSLLVTVLFPYFFMSQRFALDCNAFLPCLSLVTYLSILFYKEPSVKRGLLLGASISVTLYSYALSWIVMFIYTIAFVVAFLIKHGKVQVKTLLKSLPSFILSVPIILYVFVLMDVIPSIETKFITIAKVSAYRVNEVVPHLLSPNKYYDYFKLLLTHDNFAFSATSKYGTMFKFGFILVILGIIIFILKCKKDKKSEYSILIIGFISSILIFNFIPSICIYRLNNIYLFFAIFSSITLSSIFDLNLFAGLTGALIIIVSSTCFLNYYFTDFNKTSSNYKFFSYDLIKVSEYLKDKEGTFYVDTVGTYNEYLSVIYGLKVNPNEFVNSVEDLDFYGMSFESGNSKFIIGLKDAEINDNYFYVIKDYSENTLLYYNDETNDVEAVDDGIALENELKENDFKVLEKYGYKIYYKDKQVS